MSTLDDPHALKLHIDGNAYKNPSGAGGFACVATDPESQRKADEVVFERGFLRGDESPDGVVRLHRSVVLCGEAGKSLGVERVLIGIDKGL